MIEPSVPTWTPAGELTAVPHANDNIAGLAAAIGKWPEGVLPDCERPHWNPANDNLPPVVAFTGVAGSGKSTATRYLVERHGYTLVKFAAPLKDMMRVVGLTEDEIEGDLKEKPCSLLRGKTPRHAMQQLGTAWGRDSIGPDFWLNLWKERAVDVMARAGRVVVDDLRFPNEATAIRRLGGDIYKIEGRGGIAGEHVSERGCGDEDLVLVNTGSVDELEGKVEEAMRRYG